MPTVMLSVEKSGASTHAVPDDMVRIVLAPGTVANSWNVVGLALATYIKLTFETTVCELTTILPPPGVALVISASAVEYF